jgi:hypothetical protein
MTADVAQSNIAMVDEEYCACRTRPRPGAGLPFAKRSNRTFAVSRYNHLLLAHRAYRREDQRAGLIGGSADRRAHEEKTKDFRGRTAF